MTQSSTHLVLIPAYNPGRLLVRTVSAALTQWQDVWVIDDGSTDGSCSGLEQLGAEHTGLRVIVRPRNGGKGSAVLSGAKEAVSRGFTHALVMDGDFQHPAGLIKAFMKASIERPEALICGQPVFGPDAPWVRCAGRKLSVGLVSLMTLGRGAADPLFGFKVYPLVPLVETLESVRGARGYDFDPEVAVRLAWKGLPAVNIKAPCEYISAEAGGVSHFRYVRDNLRMIAMHARLISSLVTGRIS
jgi:glycosyltransferase involved in cell wall biosynthesis